MNTLPKPPMPEGGQSQPQPTLPGMAAVPAPAAPVERPTPIGLSMPPAAPASVPAAPPKRKAAKKAAKKAAPKAQEGEKDREKARRQGRQPQERERQGQGQGEEGRAGPPQGIQEAGRAASLAV